MIHIKDDWYIEVDESSYNLQQFNGVYIDKHGNTIKQWKNQTFHATLDRALKQYLTYSVRDALQTADDISIKEAIDIIHTALKTAREEISNITEGM